MSRSRRKTPICGITTARSEKDDKRRANRKLRRLTRTDPEKNLVMRDVSDVWSFAKDGKWRIDPTAPNLLRLMRK